MSITVGTPQQESASKPLWLDLLTTVDHKKIGIMYLVTSFVFFALGGVAALLIRLQLSRPNMDVIVGSFYNQILTAHGTTMQFLFIIPIAAGFGNYFIPLMIGARDMALPRMNAFAYWLYLFGGILLYMAPLFGGWAEGGWVAYFPFASEEYQPQAGVDSWILGLQLVGFSSIFGGINFIVTMVNLRHAGDGLAAAADVRLGDDGDLAFAGAGDARHHRRDGDHPARPHHRSQLVQPGYRGRPGFISAPVLVLLAPGGFTSWCCRGSGWSPRCCRRLPANRSSGTRRSPERRWGSRW